MRTVLILFLALAVTAVFAQENYPAKIEQINGTPTLIINGKPLFASAVRICIEDGTVSRFIFKKDTNIFRQFSQVGTPIFFLSTDMGWNGVGKHDYRYFDRVMDQLIAEYPSAYVIPSLHLYRCSWFGGQFPDESFAMIDEKGKYIPMRHCPSYFSKKFEEAAKDTMGKFIQHLEDKGYATRIVGYQVNFGRTAEWVWWDLARRRGDASPCGLKAWRQYLQEKYQTIDKLNDAHGTTWQNFEQIAPFKGTFFTDFLGGFIRDAKLDAAKRDYNRMVDKRQVELKRSLCGFVKNATRNRALVGIYNYFDQPELDGAPEIDFTVSSTIYTDRAAGGTAISQARQLEHLRRTGKLYFHDSDMRTVLSIENYWYSAFNMYDSISMMRREFGTMLAKGAGNTWFSLNPNKNVFDNPEFMRCIAETEALSETVVEKAKLDTQSNAEIAFVIDRYNDTGFWGQYTFNTCVGRVGAAVDCFPAHRLDLIGDQYKLVIFASCPFLDEKALNNLKKNGRTLLFMYATGMGTPNGLDTERISRLTGFKIKRSENNERMVHVENDFKTQFGNDALFIGRNGIPLHFFRLTAEPAQDVTVLARAHTDNAPMLVQKKFDEWNSVFWGDYQMQSEWIQQFARMAGVKICDDSTKAFFYRNKNILVVSADFDGGDKSFHLNPEDKAVIDIFAQKILPTANEKVTLKAMMPCETRLLVTTGSTQEAEAFLATYKAALARRKVTPEKSVFKCQVLPEGGPAHFVMKGTRQKVRLTFTSDDNHEGVEVSLNLPKRWKYQPIHIGNLLKYETAKLDFEIEALDSTGSDKAVFIFTDKNGKEIGRSEEHLFHCTPYTCLSDMPWVEASTGWGTIHKDASCMGRYLATGGKSHPKGLGVHANSRVVYDLGGKWRLLKGRAGIDAAQSKGGPGVASCIFSIIGDGKVLLKTPTLYGGKEAQEFAIDVSGVHKLELIVNDAGDGIKCDNADWCSMTLYP